jgi:hypothetical protein
MQKHAHSLLAVLLLTSTAVLLTGCPPQLYCSVQNHTDEPAKIDFTFEGSGTLLSHFVLAPGASRRVRTTPHLLISAHSLRGRLLGSITLTDIPRDHRYYDPASYTFGLALTGQGLVPATPSENSRNP